MTTYTRFISQTIVSSLFAFILVFFQSSVAIADNANETPSENKRPAFLASKVLLYDGATSKTYLSSQSASTSSTSSTITTGRIFNISGYLVEEDDSPTSGTFAYEVRFYKSATDTTETGDASVGTTTVKEGIFNIPVQLPLNAYAMQGYWFSLAIDTDRDGLNANDIFEDRFEIGIVPYALSGQPTFFYCTNGGAAGSSGPTTSLPVTSMIVAPFSTPAGGVQFNRMAAFFYVFREGTSQCSFGIYDTNGNAVALSGPILLPENFNGIAEVFVSGYLQPSTLYYSGWGRNIENTAIRHGLQPATPGLGQVSNSVTNGVVTNSFNPASIQTGDINTVPISITLRQAAE